MDNQFSFVKNPKIPKNIVIESIKYKHRFWKNFWKKKTNKFLIISLIIFLLLIVCLSIFNPFSATKPVLNSELVQDLPPYYAPIITKTFDKSPFTDYLFYLDRTSSFHIINYINYQSNFIITYNPYELLRQINPDFHAYFLLGTNFNGVDNLAIFSYSFLISIIIVVLSSFIQLILGSYAGVFLGFYFQRNIPKFSYWLISIIVTIPFLLINIIIFNLIGYSFLKAILVLSLVGFFPIFYASYGQTSQLVTLDYVNAYKITGLSTLKIMHKILKEILLANLPLLSEQITLGFLSLASLSFFNIAEITTQINIGNLYKQIIDNQNNWPLFTLTLISSIGFVATTKLLSFNLAKWYILR
ncbi:ABC transporter permease subunit [Mycoplasmopsis sturni]|uniref:ABC transporter permease subunit n=1 Tax=Mycoplasmopsis sturni TaxID=39047 RepID=UPI00056D7E01|nr:ABC transporter permease subunit [Mycoplasmopsis sturni]